LNQDDLNKVRPKFDVPEECVNLDRQSNDRQNNGRQSNDRRWLGTSAVRIPVVAAGLVLVAAGCMFIRGGSQPHSTGKSVGTSAFRNSPESLLASAHKPFSPASARTPINPSSVLASLPLIFEPNQGQANLNPTDPGAQFIAHGSGYMLLLGSQGATLNLRSNHLRSGNVHAKNATFDSLAMKLVGANPHATLGAADPLPGKTNYFLGNDRTHWHSNVPQFSRVRYENVYPGINLVFYGNQGQLEYDFQVAPGADPSRAELDFDGATAAAQKDGSILIKHGGNAMRLVAPHVYQEIAGRRQPVEGSFVLRGAHRAGFAIGDYDRSRELVIDPVLSFSTYFGGTGNEEATSVAVDTAGNIYLTGSTTSLPPPGGTFPVTPGVLQSAPAGPQNVYVAKITPGQPATLVYSTYVGGNGIDTPADIAVDGAGDAYIAGTTSSTNFPVTPTAYQSGPETGSAGPNHVFVTELNGGPAPAAASELLYSSYLSGNGDDLASGMTIDASGDLFVTGTTTSTDNSSTNSAALFPAITLPYGIAYQSTSLGPIQFFVTKVNTANAGKASIAYSTYFGGGITAGGAAPVDTGGGIAVDTLGNIYFDGTTNYTYTNGELGDFPILNAYQPCLNQLPPATPVNPPVCTNAATSTETDAFVAKINPNASQQGIQLQWSTYLGGIATDSASGIAVDPGAANVFVVGTTDSPGITPQLGVNSSPFQVCLDTPVNPPAGTACPTLGANPPTDAFVARLSNPASTSTSVDMTLNYFSYLGGTGNDAGLAIAVDPSDNAYLTGWTQSAGGLGTGFPVFPQPGDLQTSLLGTQDAFIARLDTTTANGQNTAGAFSSYFGGGNTTTGPNAFTYGTGIALDQSENIYFAGYTNSINMQVNGLQITNAGGFDAFVTKLGTASTLTVTGVLTLGNNQNYISAGNPATFTYTITNDGPDPAVNVVFTDNLAVNNNPNVPLTFISAAATSGTCAGGSSSSIVSCNLLSLNPGLTATVKVVLTPSPTPNGTVASFNGGTVIATAANNTTSTPTTVTAQMSDYTLSVSPPNNSVPVAGATAQYYITLTPKPVYGSNIALSCSNLPTATTCAFTPTNSVTLPSTSPGAATLNITTTARPINTASTKSGLRNFYALWFAVPGLALLGIGAGSTRRRRRLLGFLMLCALFAQLILLPACSSTTTQPPLTGTPAGTYTITVSAASGSDSKSQAIQLTVP
jgi:uncharacterized repeat protein (TIGR01451 family)